MELKITIDLDDIYDYDGEPVGSLIREEVTGHIKRLIRQQAKAMVESDGGELAKAARKATKEMIADALKKMSE